MASRFSRTALGLPGRFIIRVRFLITASPLESIALGVISMDLARMYSAMPGTRRSATAMVASGVKSLDESPVPPVSYTHLDVYKRQQFKKDFAAQESFDLEPGALPYAFEFFSFFTYYYALVGFSFTIYDLSLIHISTPSAPSFIARAASSGVSIFALTPTVLNSSAHSSMVLK